MEPEQHQSEFDRILAKILQSEESGQRASVQQWCDQYPDHEDSLRDFFENRQQLGLTRIFAGFEDSPTMSEAGRQDGLADVGDAIRYFGDYQIEEELARGGMGVVYRATQTSLNRTVALKMILAGELASDMHVARFRTEAEAAARLDHPGIVPIYEIGEHHGQHYFSMAFVAGRSLAARVAEGPLSPQEAAEIVAAAADAVHYAHERQVVHRDLKPANILMDGTRPKITDFGLAKRLDQQSMTATGEVLGTPGFMAPEQARNAESAGPLTDVYGLGAILYATLTGRPPFQAANVVETLRQLAETDPVAPRQLNPAIPADLETICLAALRKEPERRYTSARDLENDLRRYLENRPILARPVSTWEHAVKWAKRRPVIAALSTILLLTISVGSIIIASLWASERSARIAATQSERDARDSEQEAVEARDRAELQTRIAEANLVTSRLGLADLMYVSGQAGEAERRYLAEFEHSVRRRDNDQRAWWKLWRTYFEHPRSDVLPVGGSHVAVSPDNGFIAVLNGNTISLLDAHSRELLHRFTSDVGALSRAEFSPDSRWLVANHVARPPLLVWDVTDIGAVPLKLELPPAELSGTMKLMAPSLTDEAGLALLNQLNNARPGFGFRDANTILATGPTALWQFDLDHPEQPAASVAVRPRKGLPAGSESIPLAAEEHNIWMTNFGPISGVPLSVVKLPDDGDSTVVYLGMDGNRLAEITPPKSLVSALGMPETWRVLPEKERAQLIVSSVFAIHPGTLRLAVIRDNALSVWDLRNRTRLGELRWPKSSEPLRQQSWQDTQQLVFSPDGKRLAAVGDAIRVLDVESLDNPLTLQWFGDPDRTSVCFSADNQMILAADTTNMNVAPTIGLYPTQQAQVAWVSNERIPVVAADGTVFTVENFSGPSLLNWSRPTIRMSANSTHRTFTVPADAGMRAEQGIAVAADTSRFVVAGSSADAESKGTKLLSFDTVTGRSSGPIEFAGRVVGLSISPGGQFVSRLTSASIAIHALPEMTDVAEIRVLDADDAAEDRPEFGWGLTHRATTWSPDASRMAVLLNPVRVDRESLFLESADAAHLMVIDVPRRTLIHRKVIQGASAAILLHDNETLAVGLKEATSRVAFLRLTDLQPSAGWPLGAGEIACMCEHAGRHLLACATSDGKVWLWDTNRQEPLVDFELADEIIMSLHFSEDGNALRAAVARGVLQLDLTEAADRVRHFTASRAAVEATPGR